MAWLLSRCQLPEVTGETGGRWDPSAFWTVLEKVRVIGVPDLICVPGAGLATAVAEPPAGNQLTAADFELSHVLGAAETKMLPAAAPALRGTVTTLAGAESTW